MALGTWTFKDTTAAFNVTISSGTNRIGVLFVDLEYTTAPTSVTATVGGVSMTSAGTAQGSTTGLGTEGICYAFYILDANFPATGTQSVNIAITGGTGIYVYQAWAQHDERNQVAPKFATKGNSAAQTTLTIGGLSYMNDSYGLASGCNTTPSQTHTVGGSWTERWDAPNLAGDMRGYGADIVYSGTGTDSVVFTSNLAGRLGGTFLILDPYSTDTPSRVTTAIFGGSRMIVGPNSSNGSRITITR